LFKENATKHILYLRS